MKKITLALMIGFCTISYSQSFQWAAGAGGINEDKGLGIATDNSGNVYVTGFIRNTATFGTISLTSSGVEDIFLAKYDSNGNVLWAQRFGGPSNDIGYSVATDAAGNCYLAGTYKGPVAFGSFTLEASGIQDYDAFV